MKKILSILLVFIILSAQSQTVIEMRQENGIYTIPCKVNGLKLRFIFDTGASNVSMSLSEILFMLKNDYISKDDIYGVSEAQLANGDIVENTEVLIREIEIGGIILKDVKANIIHEIAAPLLLGQSAIGKLGPYQIDGKNLILKGLKNNSSFSEKVEKNFINKEEINGSFKDGFTYKSNGKSVSGLVKGFSKSFTEEFTLKDGILHGERKQWYNKSGKLSESENYVNGKKHGRCIYYWWKGDGVLKEVNYVNGSTIGKFTLYHPNGQVYFSTTLEGQKNIKKINYISELSGCLECIKNKIIVYQDDGLISKIYTRKGQNMSEKNYFYNETQTYEDEMHNTVIYSTLRRVWELVFNIESSQRISSFSFTPPSKNTRPKEEKNYILREEDYYKNYKGEEIIFKHSSYDSDGFKMYQENFDINNKKSTLILYHDNGKKSYLLEVKYLYPELKLIEIGKRNDMGDEIFLSEAYPRHELIEQKCFNQQETPIKCSDN